MTVKTVVAILRAFPGRHRIVTPPPEQTNITLDGGFDAPGLLRAASIAPEVVLLDLRGLQGQIGILIAATRVACPRARIVVIGTPDDEQMAQQSLMSGAAGFLSRDLSENALLEAITKTAQGAMHLTSTGLRAVNRIVDPHRPKPKSG